MTEVVITRDDRIESAILEGLECIPLASLVRGRMVGVKPNDTLASRQDTTGITQPDTSCGASSGSGARTDPFTGHANVVAPHSGGVYEFE
jgi:hypothetical protein